MTTKNIFLVRHAQTVFNAEHILQGQRYESELSNIGIIQADLFYSNFKNISIDKIYISGLKRSYLTAKKIIESSVPFEIINELNEINWGSIEGNKLIDETKKKYLQVIERWKNGDYSAKIENGENLHDVMNRLHNAVRIIIGKEDEKNILVVTHSRVLKILLCILLKLNIGEMDNFKHKNLTFYHLLYSNNKFTLKKKQVLMYQYNSNSQ